MELLFLSYLFEKQKECKNVQVNINKVIRTLTYQMNKSFLNH